MIINERKKWSLHDEMEKEEPKEEQKEGQNQVDSDDEFFSARDNSVDSD